MIGRAEHSGQIPDLLADFPVVAIVGARQTGKTTLATRIGAGFAGGAWASRSSAPTRRASRRR